MNDSAGSNVNARRQHGRLLAPRLRSRRALAGRQVATALTFLSVMGVSLQAQTPGTPRPEASVKLKDGSVINGRVAGMTDGKLTMSTDFDGDVVIDRSHVLDLLSELRLRLVLDDGRVLEGTVEPGPEGGNTLQIRTVDAAQPLPVPFSAVTAINPPEEKPVRFKGSANAGLTIQDGNTRAKSAYANAELIVRGGDHRGTLRGSYLYSEDSGSVSARNGRASAQYDYFVTERLYLYGSASIEADSEKNLELRTILSTGPGYQLIEEGDFEGEHVRKLESSVELGVSYVHEDFQDGTKDEFVAGRWAFDLDWEFLPERMGFFHRHEGTPSFEDFDDILIISEQGLRFTIVEGFVATAQVNWTWDNVPAADADRSDTAYLLTLGYKFDA